MGAELDISNSHLDVPLPSLLFDEPAGEGLAPLAVPAEGDPHKERPFHPGDEHHAVHAVSDGAARPWSARSAAAGSSTPRATNASRGLAQSSRGFRPLSTPFPTATATNIHPGTNTSVGVMAVGGGGDGEWGEAPNALESPRFALTLRKLTAVKTRLWKRWDLSRFGCLRALEVSRAGRTTVQQLARKVGVVP